jgi:hypothetical protein
MTGNVERTYFAPLILLSWHYQPHRVWILYDEADQSLDLDLGKFAEKMQ